jgi:hypothetical protein
VDGTLDVSGASETFNNATGTTGGGRINLTSDLGNVALGSGAYLDLAALPGGGNSGSLSVGAVNGSFSVDSVTSGGGATPTLDGRNGQGGTFALDAANLTGASSAPTSSLGYLESVLSAGGFTQSQTIRVRDGDISVDGLAKAATFNLSTDQGSIDVTPQGFVDASGATGGTIELDASGSVTLEPGSELSVRGQTFNDAGQGGTVTLNAGAYTDGSTVSTTGLRGSNGQFGPGIPVVNIEPGSTIDLSVAASATPYVATGVLELSAPQVIDQNGNPYDVRVDPIGGTIVDPSSIVVVGNQIFDLTPVGGVITGAETASVSQPSGGLITSPTVNVQASVEDNGALFAGGNLSSGGAAPGNTAAIVKSLTSGNQGLQALLQPCSTWSPGRKSSTGPGT